MKFRSLLVAGVTASVALTGVAVAPALANSPGKVPPASAGHVVTWGTSPNAIELPAELDGKRIIDAAVSSADVSGVVTEEGEVITWGDESHPANYPPASLSDATVTAIDLNGQNGLALTSDGEVVAWGGTPGIDDTEGIEAQAIALAPNGAAFAVTTDGTMEQWAEAPAVVPVSGDPTNLVDVAADNMVIALDADGNAHTWPDDSIGVSGLSAPEEIQGEVVQITTSQFLYGAVLQDGSMRIWGLTPAMAPFDASELPAKPDGQNVISLDIYDGASGLAIVAVTEDGSVHSWGDNPATVDLTEVDGINEGQQAVMVSVGRNHAAVIVTDFRAVEGPVITGTPTVGQKLTVTGPEWSLAPDSVEGQWYREKDGTRELIEGETSGELTLGEDLEGYTVTYLVKAERGSETVEAASEPVGPIAPATVASTTTLSVTPAQAAYGTARTATATVAKDGDGVATGKVTFKVGNTSAEQNLDNAGKATWTLPANLGVGSHSLTATYSGDANTEASAAAAATIRVGKAAVRMTGKKPKWNINKKAVRTKRVVFRTKVHTPAGISSTGKVRLRLKGKTFKPKQRIKKLKQRRQRATTAKQRKRINQRLKRLRKNTNLKRVVNLNANGVARVRLKGLPRGKYKVVWQYQGSATAKKARHKVNFRVPRR